MFDDPDPIVELNRISQSLYSLFGFERETDPNVPNVKFLRKGRLQISYGRYRLDICGSTNTTLWYLCDDGVLRQSYDWDIFTQIVELCLEYRLVRFRTLARVCDRLTPIFVNRRATTRDKVNEWWYGEISKYDPDYKWSGHAPTTLPKVVRLVKHDQLKAS